MHEHDNGARFKSRLSTETIHRTTGTGNQLVHLSIKLNGPESSPCPSHRIGRMLTSLKKMTPPHHLRRDCLGRLSATTRSFARPVFAPFRSPSRALRGRPLRTMDTINCHLVCCTLPVLVRAKTTLLQISDKPESGGETESSSAKSNGMGS